MMMRFGPCRKRRSNFGLFAASALAIVSSAGGGTPAEKDPRLRPGLLHIDASHAWVEFEAEYVRRRVGGTGLRTPPQRNRDARFEQTLRLDMHGDVVDPLFLSWDAGLRLGVSHQRFRETIGWHTQTESDTGLLREFDIAMQFLPAKPVSGTAFARRTRDRIPRAFLPSLVEERNEAGLAAFMVRENWRHTLGVEWSEVDRTGNRADVDDESLTASRVYLDSRAEWSPEHTLAIRFDHQRDESTFQGSAFDFDTRRDELRIDHQVALDSRRRLDTFARASVEQGDLARDEIEFSPRLTIEHDDRLTSAYRYSFYRLDRDATQLTRHRIDAQAFYDPAPNLRYHGELFFLRETQENDVEMHQYGGQFGTRYRAANRLGEWSARLTVRADRERFLGDARGGQVRGEAHNLDPSRPVYLLEPDVVPASVVAYNLDRTRIYIPGIDYLIQPIGRRVVLYRILSGRIAEGQAVYFDYRYRIPIGGKVDTYRIDFHLEQQLGDHLTAYYALDMRRQHVNRSRGTFLFADRSERHRFGLHADHDAWAVAGEIELFDDAIQPYDRYHLGGRHRLVDAAAQSVELTADADWFHFNGDFDRRRVWLVDVGLHADHRLDRYLRTTASARYRWEKDSVDGETNAVDTEIGIHFRRGLLGVGLTMEYDLLTLAHHDEGLGIWFNVRRHLPGLSGENAR